MRMLVVVPLLCAISGCFTYRGKVACKRAELVLTDRGQKGDELAAACGKEMAQTNLDTGASEVALTAADLTPEAATANTAAIEAARETRETVVAAGKGLLGSAPWGGAILAALGGAGALWLRLRKARAVLETVVEGVGKVANAPTKQAIRNLAIDAGLQPYLDGIVQRIDPDKD